MVNYFVLIFIEYYWLSIIKTNQDHNWIGARFLDNLMLIDDADNLCCALLLCTLFPYFLHILYSM